MARSADFDLGAALASPSFTPAQRDAPALVELVVGGEPSAERAAAALASLAETGRRAIEARLGGDDPHADSDATELGDAATARLVGALGQLARRGDEAARLLVLARTTDRAPRVRRAAIGALGKLGGEDARAALLARWDAADATPDERRALAEALGKVGGDDALARLRTLEPGEDAELARRRDRALLMIERTDKRGEESTVATDVDPPTPVLVRLHCKPGLGPLLVEELAARQLAPRAQGDAAADLTLDRAWSALFVSRLWASAGVRVPLAAETPEAIVAALVDTRALLAAWTRGPIRWRLGFAHGHRRAIVWRVAKDVAARAPELVNDPVQTTWDVLVGDGALELVPRRAPDPRFAWRVAEIPASSHPTVAAALAFVAGAAPGDRVWDPFCGAGAELVERTRIGGHATLVGTDVDATALDAARRNLDAASVTATLAVADARTHDPGPIDLVITNPPLGSRVAIDAVGLLVETLPNLARTLAPGGRLVWITPAPRKTSPVAERLGLRRTRALAVDLGGVRGQLERWER